MGIQRIKQKILPLLEYKLGFRSARGHTFYEKVFGPQSIIVDLGACQGEFSKHIALNYGCHVYAVEASPGLLAEIEETPLIHKYNYAIASTNGVTKFYESNLITAGTIIGPKPNSTGNIVEVETRKFSSLCAEIGLKEIDLIKIDIEGAEIQMFDTMRCEDISCAKQLTIEFHDSVHYPNVSTEDVVRIIEKIISTGFEGIARGSKNYDWLFLNKKRLHLPLHTKLYLYLRRLLIHHPTLSKTRQGVC